MNAQATPLLPHDVLWELIRDIRFAMITTRHQHGLMRSRPIETLNRSLGEDGRLWFLVPLEGDLAEELLAEPQVNLVYASPDRARYVSIAGDAGFVFDEVRKAKLFPLLAKTWGAGNNSGLLEVRIEQADAWDAASGTMLPVFRAADHGADSGFDVVELDVLGATMLPAGGRSIPVGDAAYLQ